MAQQLTNGKWNPIVFDRGFGFPVAMVELIGNEWKTVECDTTEQAEAKERECNEFWNR